MLPKTLRRMQLLNTHPKLLGRRINKRIKEEKNNKKMTVLKLILSRKRMKLMLLSVSLQLNQLGG